MIYNAHRAGSIPTPIVVHESFDKIMGDVRDMDRNLTGLDFGLYDQHDQDQRPSIFSDAASLSSEEGL